MAKDNTILFIGAGLAAYFLFLKPKTPTVVPLPASSVPAILPAANSSNLIASASNGLSGLLSNLLGSGSSGVTQSPVIPASQLPVLNAGNPTPTPFVSTDQFYDITDNVLNGEMVAGVPVGYLEEIGEI